MKKMEDYLPHYLGCQCKVEGEDVPMKLTGISFDETQKKWWAYFEGTEIGYAEITEVKPVLRPISDMIEEEILYCGKLICAVPNRENFSYQIQRHHNTVRAKFFSDKYISGQYFSIYNEKNKPESIGHIEIGWYSDQKLDRRKMKELWKVGGCHDLTIYLLSKGFDLFGLIDAGLAIDKTKISKS